MFQTDGISVIIFINKIYIFYYATFGYFNAWFLKNIFGFQSAAEIPFPRCLICIKI